MACNYFNNNCGKLCPNFVITTAVAFAADVLTLTLPDDVTYTDGCRYCIVIGQAIPDATTYNATVVAVVGDGTTTFPLLDNCGAPVLARQLSTRTKYPVRVNTTATGGSIKVLRPLPHVDSVTLNALNDAAAAGGA